ncbi:MAG: GGDEF domain-containing protein [Proteobacteria bacterium]|nr:GGDEF domain-containing protein [Pseudomonadota bacterium]
MFVARPDGTIKFTELGGAAPDGPRGRRAQRAHRRLAAAWQHDASESPIGSARRRKLARPCCARAPAGPSGLVLRLDHRNRRSAVRRPHLRGARHHDRKRAERRIRYLARYDALTGRSRTAAVQHLLRQAIARSLRARALAFALLSPDMDRFESEHTFGHGAKDRVLEALTERLTSALPDETVLPVASPAANSRCSSTASRKARREVVRLLSRDLAAVAQPLPRRPARRSSSRPASVWRCARATRERHRPDPQRRRCRHVLLQAERRQFLRLLYSEMNAASRSNGFDAQRQIKPGAINANLSWPTRRRVDPTDMAGSWAPRRCYRSACRAMAISRPRSSLRRPQENNIISSIGEWVLNRVCLDHGKIVPGRPCAGAHRPQPVTESSCARPASSSTASRFSRHGGFAAATRA